MLEFARNPSSLPIAHPRRLFRSIAAATMLKIALLIAAGATAVRAFGSMPRQLVRTEDTGWCAGGSNWKVDWPADEPTTTAKYTKCWEECEVASAQSFEEKIYGVPSRDAESNSMQRDWRMGNVEFIDGLGDCGCAASCFCQSECKCISNFGNVKNRDLISKQGAAPIAALDEPSCCEQGFTERFSYCAELYDDGRANPAFPDGRAPGYYNALVVAHHCKNPISRGATIEGPFDLDEVSANCNAVDSQFDETWVVGKVEKCIEYGIFQFVGANPVPAPFLFDYVTPENVNYTIPVNGSFYWKIACDGADRSLSIGAYWSMEDCIADDAANTNAPASLCWGPGCALARFDMNYKTPAFQYGWDKEMCGDPPEGLLY